MSVSCNSKDTVKDHEKEEEDEFYDTLDELQINNTKKDYDKLYPTHKAAFYNNYDLLRKLLLEYTKSKSLEDEIGKKDHHGNTPLHLAIMLGNKECIDLLLKNNAPIKTKNLNGWSCLAEAISYGNREIILKVYRKSKEQLKEQMNKRRPNLIQQLNTIDDFYIELKWDFQSWIPFVSRILPSDICKIYKRGSSIRFDTTLLDFNDMKWERGDISFVFNMLSNNQHHNVITTNHNNIPLVIMDNKLKIYQLISNDNNNNNNPDDEMDVDLLMSSDIMCAQMHTKDIKFVKFNKKNSKLNLGTNFLTNSSLWFFSNNNNNSNKDYDATYIGNYKAQFYTVGGINFETCKRREHLSDDDLAKNKEILMESFKSSNSSNGSNQNNKYLENYKFRDSLPSPKSIKIITWDEYINSPITIVQQSNTNQENFSYLGRPMVLKKTNKAFKATLAMSEDFPMKIEMLLNILEVVTPFKHLKKLKEFVNLRLPPGFPIKIEIPILPTITAKVTFQEFALRNDLSPDLFKIPNDYEEKLNRFPFEF